MAAKYLPLGIRGAFCAFFREPVDRVISQYRYWQRKPDPKNAMWAKFDAESMSLIRFGSMPRQRRLYRLFTSGLPMERFSFVGITEEYETSLRLFRAIFGVDIPYHRVNTGERIEVNNRERKAVERTQGENSSIYDEARRRFDAQCRLYLGN